MWRKMYLSYVLRPTNDNQRKKNRGLLNIEFTTPKYPQKTMIRYEWPACAMFDINSNLSTSYGLGWSLTMAKIEMKDFRY